MEVSRARLACGAGHPGGAAGAWAAPEKYCGLSTKAFPKDLGRLGGHFLKGAINNSLEIKCSHQLHINYKGN